MYINIYFLCADRRLNFMIGPILELFEAVYFGIISNKCVILHIQSQSYTLKRHIIVFFITFVFSALSRVGEAVFFVRFTIIRNKTLILQFLSKKLQTI